MHALTPARFSWLGSVSAAVYRRAMPTEREGGWERLNCGNMTEQYQPRKTPARILERITRVVRTEHYLVY